MSESEALQEEVTFLVDEIRSLRARIGGDGNAVQQHKLKMLLRLQSRCAKSLDALAKRAAT